MKRYLTYIKSLLLHKWYVFVAGRYVGVSLWQLLIHDLSKFGRAEFRIYALHSPTKEGRGSGAFAAAWNHHENSNPHHWGYWIPRSGKFAGQPLPMPEKYVREMVADWMGAGRAYTGRWDIADWVNKNVGGMKLDIRTQLVLVDVLIDIGLVFSQGTWLVGPRFARWAGITAEPEPEPEPPPRAITYHCPDCGRWSGGMKLLDKHYEPRMEDLSSRPSVFHVGSEILACPCGRELTWYEMEKRNNG